MKSNKYEYIIQSIEECIKKGKQDSLLNRMQFDYEIRNVHEFSNYLLILLTLMEKGNYEISNNIFLRKIVNAPERFTSFLSGIDETFELIKSNSVFPFVGISNTIRSLIMEIIDEDESLEFLKEIKPKKEFLQQLNFEFLKKYFLEVKKEIVFGHYIRLLYNCIKDIDKQSREVKLLSEATEFFKVTLIIREDIFIHYLHHFLRSGGMKYSVPNISSLQVVPEPFFEQIFGSIEEFEILLAKSNSNLKNDIQNFLTKYKLSKKVFIEDIKIKKEMHEFLKNEK